MPQKSGIDLFDAISRSKHYMIMITHYLPAVVNADRIFVLSEGRLVEQGTHSELLAHSGVYQQLWNSQSHAD